MGLLNLFKKKEIIKSNSCSKSNLAKSADYLEHLNENGELPWGWHTHNKAFTEKINTEYTYFLNMWLDSQKQEPKKQYEALKSFVLYMEDVEKVCKSKGECFEFWFNEILTSPGYLEQRKEELKNLSLRG